jgi:PAS domain S-box-containing protein
MSLEPPPEPARSRRQWLDRHPLTARVLLVGALAGATAVLVVMAKLAAFSTSAGHAYGMGLAAGLGWAAGLRYGPTMLFGLALGGIGGMLYAGAGPMLATTATALACTSLAVSARLLRHTAFDWRMERARDVAWLAAAAAGWAALNALLLTVLAAFPARGLPLGAQGVAWLWAQGVVCFLIGALPALTLDRRALPLLGHRSRMLALLLLSVAAGASAVAPFLANPMTGGTWSWLWFVPQVLLAVMVIVGGTAPAASTLLIVSLTLSWAGHQPGVLGGYESLVSELHVAGAVSSMLAIVLLQHALVAESSWREQRWEWALDGSRLGVADWHLQRPDSFVSTAWRALTGAPPGHWRSDQWVGHTHPDDRKLLEHALAQVSRGEVGRMRVDLRMPHLNGWRWLEATLLVIERDMSGTPVRLLATVADVHDRHEAQHQQRLSASLFQHLHEGLLITDAELRVLDANPAYTDILGVTACRDAGFGAVAAAPFPGRPAGAAAAGCHVVGAATERRLARRIVRARRSGEICTLQVTISPVLGPADGALRYHVLVISDITEQRLQREQLERQAHFDELTRLPNRTLSPAAGRRHAPPPTATATCWPCATSTWTTSSRSTTASATPPATAC